MRRPVLLGAPASRCFSTQGRGGPHGRRVSPLHDGRLAIGAAARATRQRVATSAAGPDRPSGAPRRPDRNLHLPTQALRSLPAVRSAPARWRRDRRCVLVLRPCSALGESCSSCRRRCPGGAYRRRPPAAGLAPSGGGKAVNRSMDPRAGRTWLRSLQAPSRCRRRAVEVACRFSHGPREPLSPPRVPARCWCCLHAACDCRRDRAGASAT
jgi:hypothetical protein